MAFLIPVIILAGATFVGSFLSIQEESSRTPPPPSAITTSAPTVPASPNPNPKATPPGPGQR